MSHIPTVNQDLAFLLIMYHYRKNKENYRKLYKNLSEVNV